MNEFRTKLGEDGRIVIPASCRKQLHLKAGEELVIHIVNDEMHLASLNQSLKKAQMLVRQHTKKQSLVTQLKLMRKEDSQNE